MKTALLLFGILVGMSVSSHAQNKTPSFTMTFSGGFGCDEIWGNDGGPNVVGRTSCDYAGAAYFLDGGLAFYCCPAQLLKAISTPPRDHNHELKGLFKGAATRASVLPGPFQEFYQRSLAQGIQPTMVRLTMARKIAAITLTLWKKGENFDAEKLKSQAA